MKVLIPLKGRSQYDPSISKPFRSSACGPVTAAVILEYHDEEEIKIEPLYRMLGTTPIGLFRWRMICRLRRLLGLRYDIGKLRSLEEVKAELLAGRPVAMKFDKYFTFRWFDRPLYSYHWVPLIGFREEETDTVLLFHDNGGPGRESRIRSASFRKNQRVLSFVKIRPLPRS